VQEICTYPSFKAVHALCFLNLSCRGNDQESWAISGPKLNPGQEICWKKPCITKEGISFGEALVKALEQRRDEGEPFALIEKSRNGSHSSGVYLGDVQIGTCSHQGGRFTLTLGRPGERGGPLVYTNPAAPGLQSDHC
jgi:hypothetical protein